MTAGNIRTRAVYVIISKEPYLTDNLIASTNNCIIGNMIFHQVEYSLFSFLSAYILAWGWGFDTCLPKYSAI